MRYRTPLRLIGGLSAFLLFWVAVDATSRTGDTSRLDAVRFDPNRRALSRRSTMLAFSASATKLAMKTPKRGTAA
jgi:hypothetical protein